MKKDKKYYLGIALFVYCFIPYVFTFLVLPFLPVSKVTAVSLATGLLISSEVSFLLCVALLGKTVYSGHQNKDKRYFQKKECGGSQTGWEDSARCRHHDAAGGLRCTLFPDRNRTPSGLCGEVWPHRF